MHARSCSLAPEKVRRGGGLVKVSDGHRVTSGTKADAGNLKCREGTLGRKTSRPPGMEQPKAGAPETPSEGAGGVIPAQGDSQPVTGREDTKTTDPGGIWTVSLRPGRRSLCLRHLGSGLGWHLFFQPGRPWVWGHQQLRVGRSVGTGAQAGTVLWSPGRVCVGEGAPGRNMRPTRNLSPSEITAQWLWPWPRVTV